MNMLRNILLLMFMTTMFATTQANAVAHNPEFQRVVTAYEDAQKNPKQIDSAYTFASQYVSTHPKDGIAITYKGSLAAMRARESILPWRKISYLNEGTRLMDDGVEIVTADKTLVNTAAEIEVRMVRGITSARIPAVFGRGKVAKADFKRIIDHPKFPSMSATHQATALAWMAVLSARNSDQGDANQWLNKAREVDSSVANRVWESQK